MQLVSSNQIAHKIELPHPRRGFMVQLGRVSAYVCIEDPAPPGARLRFLRAMPAVH